MSYVNITNNVVKLKRISGAAQIEIDKLLPGGGGDAAISAYSVFEVILPALTSIKKIVIKSHPGGTPCPDAPFIRWSRDYTNWFPVAGEGRWPSTLAWTDADGNPGTLGQYNRVPMVHYYWHDDGEWIFENNCDVRNAVWVNTMGSEQEMDYPMAYYGYGKPFHANYDRAANSIWPRHYMGIGKDYNVDLTDYPPIWDGVGVGLYGKEAAIIQTGGGRNYPSQDYPSDANDYNIVIPGSAVHSAGAASFDISMAGHYIDDDPGPGSYWWDGRLLSRIEQGATPNDMQIHPLFGCPPYFFNINGWYRQPRFALLDYGGWGNPVYPDDPPIALDGVPAVLIGGSGMSQLKYIMRSMDTLDPATTVYGNWSDTGPTPTTRTGAGFINLGTPTSPVAPRDSFYHVHVCWASQYGVSSVWQGHDPRPITPGGASISDSNRARLWMTIVTPTFEFHRFLIIGDELIIGGALGSEYSVYDPAMLRGPWNTDGVGTGPVPNLISGAIGMTMMAINPGPKTDLRAALFESKLRGKWRLQNIKLFSRPIALPGSFDVASADLTCDAQFIRVEIPAACTLDSIEVYTDSTSRMFSEAVFAGGTLPSAFSNQSQVQEANLGGEHYKDVGDLLNVSTQYNITTIKGEVSEAARVDVSSGHPLYPQREVTATIINDPASDTEQVLEIGSPHWFGENTIPFEWCVAGKSEGVDGIVHSSLGPDGIVEGNPVSLSVFVDNNWYRFVYSAGSPYYNIGNALTNNASFQRGDAYNLPNMPQGLFASDAFTWLRFDGVRVGENPTAAKGFGVLMNTYWNINQTFAWPDSASSVKTVSDIRSVGFTCTFTDGSTAVTCPDDLTTVVLPGYTLWLTADGTKYAERVESVTYNVDHTDIVLTLPYLGPAAAPGAASMSQYGAHGWTLWDIHDTASGDYLTLYWARNTTGAGYGRLGFRARIDGEDIFSAEIGSSWFDAISSNRLQPFYLWVSDDAAPLLKFYHAPALGANTELTYFPYNGGSPAWTSTTQHTMTRAFYFDPATTRVYIGADHNGQNVANMWGNENTFMQTTQYMRNMMTQNMRIYNYNPLTTLMDLDGNNQLHALAAGDALHAYQGDLWNAHPLRQKVDKTGVLPFTSVPWVDYARFYDDSGSAGCPVRITADVDLTSGGVDPDIFHGQQIEGWELIECGIGGALATVSATTGVDKDMLRFTKGTPGTDKWIMRTQEKIHHDVRWQFEMNVNINPDAGDAFFCGMMRAWPSGPEAIPNITRDDVNDTNYSIVGFVDGAGGDEMKFVYRNNAASYSTLATGLTVTMNDIYRIRIRRTTHHTDVTQKFRVCVYTPGWNLLYDSGDITNGLSAIFTTDTYFIAGDLSSNGDAVSVSFDMVRLNSPVIGSLMHACWAGNNNSSLTPMWMRFNVPEDWPVEGTVQAGIRITATGLK